MLNPTVVIRHIEKKLGYRFNELEISTEEILENIRSESLYTYSKKFPYIIRYRIDIGKDLVPGYKNRYYLKTEGYEVFGVKEVFLTNSLYGDATQLTGYNVMQQNIVDIQLANDILSGIRTPTTFRYFHDDNTIEIYPFQFTRNTVLVELKVKHLEDFSTIKDNMRDEFLKLCVYDTQEVLYQIRHRFSNLQTAFGNIELFIDDLQNATDKREELLEKWRRNFYKDAERKKIYIY